ncbi:MAG: hypothetical protein KDB27_19055 [Planctomycetales bacterium]|nr:hypothetical protein [Planctomycetales bacterium]
MRSQLCKALTVGAIAFAILANADLSIAQRTSAPQIAAATKEVLKAQNLVQLRQNVGEHVTVSGTVARATKSSTGHQFLNFQASELSVVCLAADAKNFTKGSIVDLYKNKTIEIEGKLELYKNKPQIKITSPDQIRLVTADKDGGEAKEDVGQSYEKYLKQIGVETWISPAGLKYTGRDPDGMTRVEHVLRHAQDVPDRRGSHGVFDGGKHKAFQTIDAAWKLAQKQRARPKVEGDRSTYTINMGRRVGYLGGQNGKRRRNPALNRVFIVVRTNTSEVVTAFPK